MPCDSYNGIYEENISPSLVENHFVSKTAPPYVSMSSLSVYVLMHARNVSKSAPADRYSNNSIDACSRSPLNSTLSANATSVVDYNRQIFRACSIVRKPGTVQLHWEWMQASSAPLLIQLGIVAIANSYRLTECSYRGPLLHGNLNSILPTRQNRLPRLL